MRRALVVVAFAVLSSAEALACPFDEGGVTIHPGTLGGVTTLPSRPSLYFQPPGFDHRLEIESNGRPVAFTEVPVGDAMRIDIDLDAGPLVVRSVAYRSFTYEYRVVPGLAVNHDAVVERMQSNESYTDLDLTSEAGLVRIEWADGAVEPWDHTHRIVPTVEVYTQYTNRAFRVVGLFADRSRAVLWDPAGDLGEVAVRTAGAVRAWLVPAPAVRMPARRTPRGLIGGLALLGAGIAIARIRANRAALSATSADR